MDQLKSWKFFVMFSFIYMLHEGVLVVYTLASALVRLEVGLVVLGGFAVSPGLPTGGAALVGLLLAAAVALAALALTVVVVVMTVVEGLVAGFVGLDTVGGLAGAGAALALVTGLGLEAAAGAGLTGLAAFGGAWAEGLAGFVGLDRLAVLVSTCCSGPFSWGLLVTAGGFSIIRIRSL